MKRILVFLFCLFTLTLFASNKESIRQVTVSGGSGTLSAINLVPQTPEFIWLYPNGGSTVSLSQNLIQTSTGSADSITITRIQIYWRGGDFQLNGHTFSLFGDNITQDMLNSDDVRTYFFRGGQRVIQQGVDQFDLNDTTVLNGSVIINGTIQPYKLVGSSTLNSVFSTKTVVAGIGFPDWVTLTSLIPSVADSSIGLNQLKTAQGAQIPIANGTTGEFQARTLSGAATLSNTGVVTLSTCYVRCQDSGTVYATPSYVNSQVGTVYKASISLSSAQILALNGTPIQVVPAVTGKIILALRGNVNYTFVSAAYTTNKTLQLITNTATFPQLQSGVTMLGATVSQNVIINVTNAPGITDTQLIPSQPLMVTVASGNPAAGDGTAIITVYYLLQ